MIATIIIIITIPSPPPQVSSSPYHYWHHIYCSYIQIIITIIIMIATIIIIITIPSPPPQGSSQACPQAPLPQSSSCTFTMSDCSTILFYCSIVWFPKPLFQVWWGPSLGKQLPARPLLLPRCETTNLWWARWGGRGGRWWWGGGGGERHRFTVSLKGVKLKLGSAGYTDTLKSRCTRNPIPW